MIQIEKTEVYGWEAAIRGMRNPMNSWERSDTEFSYNYVGADVIIGENDLDLMKRLAKGGAVHAKYRRMINVTVDITAPLYWWKEFDTYKVGTVANSCSTMHKLHAKQFTTEDFSTDHLDAFSIEHLETLIFHLNRMRDMFLETKNIHYWWQMIQLLPSSYNQKRTIQMNYEVLVGMYRDRKNHKLTEWVDFCKWIETLPYAEAIICG